VTAVTSFQLTLQAGPHRLHTAGDLLNTLELRVRFKVRVTDSVRVRDRVSNRVCGWRPCRDS